MRPRAAQDLGAGLIGLIISGLGTSSASHVLHWQQSLPVVVRLLRLDELTHGSSLIVDVEACEAQLAQHEDLIVDDDHVEDLDDVAPVLRGLCALANDAVAD